MAHRQDLTRPVLEREQGYLFLYSKKNDEALSGGASICGSCRRECGSGDSLSKFGYNLMLMAIKPLRWVGSLEMESRT